MEGDRISYHESVRRVYEKIKRDNMNNIWDRYDVQGFSGNPDKRWPFCMGGVRCDGVVTLLQLFPKSRMLRWLSMFLGQNILAFLLFQWVSCHGL